MAFWGSGVTCWYEKIKIPNNCYSPFLANIKLLYVLNRSEAFAQYGAKLKNFVWSVAAESDDGDLVLSLWKQYFLPPKDGEIRYVDKASRWTGAGNNEFRKYLDQVNDKDQRIRVVIGRSDNEKGIAAGEDASKFKNTFHVRKDWIGKLESWDGDNFHIVFRADV